MGLPLGLWPTAHSHDIGRTAVAKKGWGWIGRDCTGRELVRRTVWLTLPRVGRGRCAQGANGRYYKGRDDSLASPRASFDRLLRVLSDT